MTTGNLGTGTSARLLAHINVTKGVYCCVPGSPSKENDGLARDAHSQSPGIVLYFGRPSLGWKRIAADMGLELQQ
jgi:hypothetical protein